MGEKIIALTPWPGLQPATRASSPLATLPAALPAGADRIDQLGRPLRDLRISVTDRCNFRCCYCMPKEVFDHRHDFLPHDALLSFEEVARISGLFVQAGVRKLRLTGGEPLLRRHLERLVAQLSALRGPDGSRPEITLTTNGSVLARKARLLKDAGLDRVTVSLDAIDDAVFQAMNDVGFPVADVLAGIDAAVDAGLLPVKVNMVVKKGFNDDQIAPLALALRDRYGSAVVLRFIEYMDVGSTNGWRLDEVLPSTEVLRRLEVLGPMTRLPARHAGETAERWRTDADGFEIGLISSVTRAFCGDCNRARLSTEGQLFLCLFASQGHDLRSLLRGGGDDGTIAAAIDHLWLGREDRYSALRAAQTGRPDAGELPPARKVEMHYIGG